MRRLTALLALLGPAIAGALPAHAPWPGGIAVLPLDSEERPALQFGGHEIAVVQHEGRWHAVAGIPLDQSPGPAVIRGEDEEIVFVVGSRAYREQHLSVQPSYVNPDPEALERIRGERRQISAAITAFSPREPDALRLQSPVPGRRSDSFGSRRYFNGEPRAPHRGMDLAGTSGTPVVAAAAGSVALAGDFFFTGRTVIVDHGQGFKTLYAHLDDLQVATGDDVARGAQLGTVGATGRVTGPHLHFAVYLNGTPVDPALLLEAAPAP